jgi:hypothetical protein
MATTQLSDVIGNPQVFGQWLVEETKRLSNIDNSPIVQDDDELNQWLKSEGNIKWTGPRYDSLDRTQAEVVITQTDGVQFTGGTATPAPQKITSHIEEAVRTERSNWWSASQLSKYLNLRQDDPLQAILADLGGYWAFRRQAMWLASWVGVFAANDLAPVNGSTHTQFDLTLDRSNVGNFSAGITNFTAENAIDTLGLMGDAEDDLGYIVTHSTVRRTMEKNDLLDVIKDSAPGQPKSYRGRPIIINDEMTKGAGNVYHTYFMGAGCTRRGVGIPDEPVELARFAEAGNGAGQNVIFNRVRWCLHPKGYRFFGTPAAAGGATNAELQTAANWVRSAKERKQIPVARLITTES